MTDIEPPTKRICLVAPKGSVSNNPFRMLPSEVLSNIKAMKSDKHPPTPTALLIKDLEFVESDFGLVVSTSQPTTFRERVCYHMMGIRLWIEGAIETTMLRFQMDSESYKELEERSEHSVFVLGRVLSDNEVALRRMQGNPSIPVRVGRRDEIHRLWLAVQREQAEASGMY